MLNHNSTLHVTSTPQVLGEILLLRCVHISKFLFCLLESGSIIDRFQLHPFHPSQHQQQYHDTLCSSIFESHGQAVEVSFPRSRFNIGKVPSQLAISLLLSADSIDE